MKKNIITFLLIWIGLINCSFVKADKIDDLDDCYYQRNCIITEQENSSEYRNLKQKDIKNISKKQVYIRYYQNHLIFIKNFEKKHPYLRKDILKYHKLFNKWFLELVNNWNISPELIKKINKSLNSLYLKAEYYE